MKYENLERFTAWLDEIMNCSYDLDAILDELLYKMGANGYIDSGTYEMEQWYTKSGRPECYRYDIEVIWPEDGEDVEETVITF